MDKKIHQLHYVPRELEKTISKYLVLPEILAIVGPRRSGKTTFLEHLFRSLADCSVISFENQVIADLFDVSPDTFAQRYLVGNRYLIIDEFQNAKHGGKRLKYLFDSNPGKKIIISGSSSPDLTIKAIRFLTGRALAFTLLPFSFREFVTTKPSAPTPEELRGFADEYMTYGGYPEVVLQSDIETKKTLLQNIYSLFFAREVKDMTSLTDDYKLKNLLKALALSIGNLIEYRELSQISGFDHLSLKRYLNFLEKTFIAFPVFPFFRNRRTELVKNPKLYFFDMGLRNSLIDNFQQPAMRTDKGALVENFIAIMLTGRGLDRKFWRTKNKAEVDFAWEKEGKLFAAEVKAGIETHLPASLASFIAKYHPAEAYVFNESYRKTCRVGSTPLVFHPYWQTSNR